MRTAHFSDSGGGRGGVLPTETPLSSQYSQQQATTRKHSSRMRTAHFSDSGRGRGGVLPTETPCDRHPLDRDPLDRDPLEGTWDQGQRALEGTWD